MSTPMKRAGFSQGIYAQSSTKKERIGTKRILQDGRVFRYARAGASALSPGFLGFATQGQAEYTKKACPVAAVGTKQMTLTISAASPAIAENYFENGVMLISTGTGIGESYQLKGNSAVAASGTSIIVTLDEGLRTALTASAYFTLVANPWAKVVESATEENIPVGTPLISVTANYYYWAQTKGIGAGRVKAKRGKAQTTFTLTVGARLIPSVSAGWISPTAQTANFCIPVHKPVVATFMGVANASAVSTWLHDAVPVMWQID